MARAVALLHRGSSLSKSASEAGVSPERLRKFVRDHKIAARRRGRWKVNLKKLNWEVVLYVSPYDVKDAPDSIPAPRHELKDVERREHDLWYLIVQAELDGDLDRVELSSLPGFNKPAASQFTASSPDRLNWFRRYNSIQPPEKRVRPGNFLLTFQARPQFSTMPVRIVLRDTQSKRGARRKPKPIRPVSPYDRDPAKAAKKAFDRETFEPVKVADLLTYAEVLRDYARHCESFNGKLRDELLNGEIFYTLKEAKIMIEAWRRHYNTVRPHSSLGYRPPAPEAICWPADRPDRGAVAQTMPLN